jgi:hypothetical protein
MKNPWLLKTKNKYFIAFIILGFFLTFLGSAQASAAKLGSPCKKINAKSWSGNTPIVCLKISGKLKWQKFTDKSAPSNTPVVSEADKFAKQGCSSMPSAIINYGNSSGGSFGSARMRLQEASFGIVQAAALDKKYQSLSTAQRIIIQYVQAVGWDGQGFFGDANTVRISIDTFNSYCGSNLSLN